MTQTGAHAGLGIGIANHGTLMAKDSTINDNGQDGAGVEGGGISNYAGGAVTLVRTSVSGNTLGSGFGGCR